MHPHWPERRWSGRYPPPCRHVPSESALTKSQHNRDLPGGYVPTQLIPERCSSPDPVAAKFHGSFFGEHFNPALACGIRNQRRKRQLVASRAEINDRPAAVIFHVSAGLLRTQEASLQVRIDN